MHTTDLDLISSTPCMVFQVPPGVIPELRARSKLLNTARYGLQTKIRGYTEK